MVLDCSGYRRRRLPERAASIYLSPRFATRADRRWHGDVSRACSRACCMGSASPRCSPRGGAIHVDHHDRSVAREVSSGTGTSDGAGCLGGTGTVSVSTQPECAWSATRGSQLDFGFVPSLGARQRTGGVSGPANPLPSARQGAIAVNDNRVSISQEAATCAFEIAPLTQSVAAGGGTGSVTVTTAAGCAWTASQQCGVDHDHLGCDGERQRHCRVQRRCRMPAANEPARSRLRGRRSR